jgi:hypothetical protein
MALDLSDPLAALNQAAQVLGLPAQPALNNFLSQAQVAWARLFISGTN